MRAWLARFSIVLAMCLASAAISAHTADTANGQTARLKYLAAPGLDYVRLFGGTKTERNPVVALGGRDNIFVAGTTTSPNWPIHWGAKCLQQTCQHAFLLKLSADAVTVLYAGELGGQRDTTVTGLAVDTAGNAYLTGTTTSRNFPTLQAFQGACAGTTCHDGFVAKVSPKGALLYSTFLGGRGTDTPTAIALDRHANIYVAGATDSPNFPTTKATQSRPRGKTDGFVTKIDAGGKRLLYSTYLGGSKSDIINAIAVDTLGQAYVTGSTGSSDLRVSARATQSRYIGGDCTFFKCDDAFVTKLGTAGRFLTGTFIATPGDENGNAITIDHLGNVYVAGDTTSSVIPTQTAAPAHHKLYCGEEGDIQPCYSAYVLELSPRLDHLIYSRVLAGDGLDNALTLAVNYPGNAVVGGYTESGNFPTVNPVQAKTGGGDCPEAKGESVPCDGFMAVIGPKNNALRFSTYLGGNASDEIDSLALDGHGNAIVVGTTESTNFGINAATPLPKVFVGRVEQLYR